MAPSRGAASLSRSLARDLNYSRNRFRGISTTSSLLSGHNRWSKIKHDKGKADALKNRQRSIFASEISTASKLFGPDPAFNPRLADLITKAKREGFAKASIEGAIARGQGRSLSGASLETIVVEAVMPGNVAVIVECETDNKLRTLADVRLAIKEHGGSATPTGYLFEKKGRIVFEQKDDISSVDVLEPALEAGATDVDEDEDGRVVVFAEPSETKAVGEAISRTSGLQIATSEIFWDPVEDTKVALTNEEAAQELAAFIDVLQDREPSVRAVAMNVSSGTLEQGVWDELKSRIGL